MIPLRSMTSLIVVASMLASCGGGDGGGGSTGAATQPPTAAPAPAPSASCSLQQRQLWVESNIREWYLFPETLPASLSPDGFSSVDAFIDALTATARAQGRDRFFTYLTSIAEENAFNSSGSTAGFGFRLQTDGSARRAYIAEVFETAPAFGAGIVRGDEIIAVGSSAGNLRPVSDIIAAEGTGGVSQALGPSDPGVTRVLQLTGAGGTRTVTVTKADYSLRPLSDSYGARIIEDGGKRVGYLNMRTFISSADPQLRAAFDQFRQAGVTELVIDFRYNGGGLVSIAELMGDLMGRNRFSTEVFAQTVFRPEKSASNTTKRFAPQPQSIAPTRIAFITTGATASASEFVMNGMLPYLGQNVAMIGANSFGKPVGQIARDRAACDDRLRVVAFSTRNSAGSDNYFQGMAATVPNTCQARDDLSQPLGDRAEDSLAKALDFLAGRGSCTPIPVGATGQSLRARAAELLAPAAPNAAQREVPGLF